MCSLIDFFTFAEEDIKCIYIEDMGSEPPAYIRVYHSDDFKNLNTIDSGFDGTVIHLYDEKKGINQKYTIAQGSEMREADTWKPLDWAYNALGIFVGQSRSQFNDAIRFDEKVT